MPRSISFEAACMGYKNRFTCENVPAWSSQSFREQGGDSDLFCAPQYKTDKEWYDNTDFPGENDNNLKNSCHSHNASWPMGKSLASPFRRS